MSVAAASIVAKVTEIVSWPSIIGLYPHYNFLSHKGYGTEEHLQQLATHGPCLIHRRTYAPVADVIARSRDVRPEHVGGNRTDNSVTILDPRRLFGQEGEAEAERYLRREGLPDCR